VAVICSINMAEDAVTRSRITRIRPNSTGHTVKHFNSLTIIFALIEKRVMDFILVLIELFSLCYG